MKAMVLNRITDLRKNREPLRLEDFSVPELGRKEILIRVATCGVCHTELDEIEGRTAPPELPVVPGHEVIGRVEKRGADARRFKTGERVGMAWIYWACGECEFCGKGLENLCPQFKATGRDADGGYAEYMKAPEDFAFAIPEIFTDTEAAPLMCAGAIGYRALELTGIKNGQTLGLTGFGASAHLALQLSKHNYPDTDIYVFARNPKEREFALELGAVWAGDTEESSPEKLNCIIDTTPVWKPVVEAMKNLKPGGRLVINAIRKEEMDKDYLLKLSYHEHLWLEKEIKSVANVTRKDVKEFLKSAAEIPIKPSVQEYALDEANKALLELKESKIRGGKVLHIDR